MRKNRIGSKYSDMRILALDDDNIMTVTLQAYLQTSGYEIDIENDPLRAIDRIRAGGYDILLLDFLMRPICGNDVVASIREFNKDLYIIMLTGHKSLAPPIKTIRELDIQGYYEKSDRFDQLELLVESCAKSIRQMRTIRSYRDGLQQLLVKNPMLYQFQPMGELLQKLLKCMDELFGEADSFLYVRRPSEENGKEGTEEHFFGKGRYERFLVYARECLDKIAQEEKQIESGKLEGYANLFVLSNEWKQPVGILCIDIPENAGEGIIQLFHLFVRQATSAVSNIMLHEIVNEKNIQLNQAYGKLKGTYDEMIYAVRSMVDARDIYTCGHSDRVAYYARAIAEAMEKDQEYQEKIHVAGIFHDIGKIGIPDNILSKSGRLTEEEYENIKTHPGKGADILSATSLFSEIAPIVRAHHERIDGKGYPDGLLGSAIPEEARIISIADAFDAMTSHRRYRENFSLEQALQELLDGRGKQFDKQIVNVFVRVLKEKYEKIQLELAWTHLEEPLEAKA